MKADIRIENSIHHVEQHIISDIKRLVAPYSEFKRPAVDAPVPVVEEGAAAKKLKAANKKINELEKQVKELKDAQTSGGE